MPPLAVNLFLPVLFGMSGVILLVVSFIFIHIRNQNILLKQRAAFREAELAHQKELLRAVIQSQEKEQRRIGRDLHDDVGTALSRLRLNIERTAQEAQQYPGMEQLHTASTQIIDKVMKDVRNISHQLTPVVLNLYGFTEAVEELADMVNAGGPLRFSLHNEAAVLLGSLGPVASSALYRVIQELLANTQKHAGATAVELSFTASGFLLHISYRDNGKGLPAGNAPSRGMGLQNIESRLGMIGAVYTINSPGHKGFQLDIQLIVTNEPTN